MVKVHTTWFVQILCSNVSGGNHVTCTVPNSAASPAVHEQFALAFNQCLQRIVDFVELHLNSKALLIQLVDIGFDHTRHNRVAHHEQPAVHVVEFVFRFATIRLDLVFTQSRRHHHDFVGECYISELGHDTNVDVTDFAVALFVLDLLPVCDEEVVTCLTIDLVGLHKVFDLVVPDSVTFSREDFMVEVFELAEHRVDLWMQYWHLQVDVGETSIAVFLANTAKDADREQSVLMKVLRSAIEDIQATYRLDRSDIALIELQYRNVEWNIQVTHVLPL